MKWIACFLLLVAAPLYAERGAVTMELDWKPNVQFAGILLAKEKGWYAEAGLDVSVAAFDFKKDVVAAVAASDHSVGSSESGALLQARAKGLRVKAVATMFQGSPLSFISLKSRGIVDVAALNGKRIGVHSDAQKALDVIAAYNRISDFKAFPVETGYAMKELKDGTVDAAQGYVIDEAVLLRLEGREIDLIQAADNGYAAYSQVFFVSEAFIAKHPEIIRKFLRVSFRGWKAALEDPGTTARLVIEKYYPEGNLKYQTESLRQIGTLMRRENSQIGQMRLETWEAAGAMFRRYRIGQVPDSIDEVVDFRFLKAIYP